MQERFVRLPDNSIFDNTTFKRHMSLDELMGEINDMHNRLTDYDDNYAAIKRNLAEPSHALQLGETPA